MKIIRSFLILITLVSGQSDADRWFEALAEEYLDQFPVLSPVSATSLGDHRYDHLVNEVSAEARAEGVAFNRQFLAKLEAIPRSQLSRAYQVDAALLENRLRSGIWWSE